MAKYLLVGGRFDNEGGKQSGYVRKLATALQREMPGDWEVCNGGQWDTLERDMEEKIKAADMIFWFPDIPNDKQKLVHNLKRINPKTMLVTSKNNIEEDGRNYSRLELVARALQSKSNLLIELNKNSDGKFVATIIDPLGNEYAFQESSVDKIARALTGRLSELQSYTRVGSRSVGDVKLLTSNTDIEGFFDLVRNYADEFHTLTHAVHQDRLLGNVSFRCERGFPSFRDQEGEDAICVSRRNIDKRHIDRDGFVVVDANMKDGVKYHGDVKPSVDTPVQLGLYQYYPNVNFMLHSHTYIEDAPFTEGMTPCGALEEIEEVKKLYPDPNQTDFFVNLKGHGSLALVSDWQKLKNLPYVNRDTYDDPMRGDICDKYQQKTFRNDDRGDGKGSSRA